MSGLKEAAQAIRAQGRYGDTELVHLNPMEVRWLQSMSPTGELTVNPQTGLKEAFLPMFGALLGKMLIPSAASALGMGAIGATAASALGAGIGGLVQSGSLEKGLMTGLGAFALGGLGDLAGAGTDAAGAAIPAPSGAETMMPYPTDASSATAGLMGAQPAVTDLQDFNSFAQSPIQPLDVMPDTLAGASSMTPKPTFMQGMMQKFSDNPMMALPLVAGASSLFESSGGSGGSRESDEQRGARRERNRDYMTQERIDLNDPYNGAFGPEREWFRYPYRGFNVGGVVRGMGSSLSAAVAPPVATSSAARNSGGIGAAVMPPNLNTTMPVNNFSGPRGGSLANQFDSSGLLPPSASAGGGNLNTTMPVNNFSGPRGGSLANQFDSSGLLPPSASAGGGNLNTTMPVNNFSGPRGGAPAPMSPGDLMAGNMRGFAAGGRTDWGDWSSNDGHQFRWTGQAHPLMQNVLQIERNDGNKFWISYKDALNFIPQEEADRLWNMNQPRASNDPYVPGPQSPAPGSPAPAPKPGSPAPAPSAPYIPPPVFSDGPESGSVQNVFDYSRGRFRDAAEMGMNAPVPPPAPGLPAPAPAPGSPAPGSPAPGSPVPPPAPDTGKPTKPNTPAPDIDDEGDQGGGDPGDYITPPPGSDNVPPWEPGNPEHDDIYNPNPGGDNVLPWGPGNPEWELLYNPGPGGDNSDGGPDWQGARSGGGVTPRGVRRFQGGGLVEAAGMQGNIATAVMALQRTYETREAAEADAAAGRGIAGELGLAPGHPIFDIAFGKRVGGAGDGMSDSIPANIDGQEPVMLASGEHVIPADAVSHIGNGDTEAGHRALEQMIKRARMARTGSPEQAPPVNPRKAMPV